MNIPKCGIESQNWYIFMGFSLHLFDNEISKYCLKVHQCLFSESTPMQYSISISPENVRKPLIFWRIHRV